MTDADDGAAAACASPAATAVEDPSAAVIGVAAGTAAAVALACDAVIGEGVVDEVVVGDVGPSDGAPSAASTVPTAEVVKPAAFTKPAEEGVTA
ncbi:hypothetical protein [Georgenia yuyongxinii]